MRKSYLYNNAISNISALAALKHLRVLSLSNNSIPTLTPLAGLTRLLNLQLSGNLVTDIAPLAGLTELRFLEIGNNGISNISPLTKLIQLTSLYIRNNAITDITPLKKLTNLTHLNLGLNHIRNITPLAELTNLKTLQLDYNQIADISSLINLVRLEKLGLAGNPIADTSILQVLLKKTPGIDIDILQSLVLATKITGPWLWIIAPTEPGRGGTASIDVDSLAAASNGTKTEIDIAVNGAKVGDTIGDYVWRLGKISEHGSNNVNDLVNRIRLVVGGNPATTADDIDINDHSAYALITLESATVQSNVTMLAGSDDAIKIWLNGEIVHNNPVDRGANAFQDLFKVDLEAGDNFLMVKVSEGSGEWSMFVGIDADVKVKQQFTNTSEKIAAAPRDTEALLPITTELFPNYPNPFNPDTWIPYQLKAPTEVIVYIYAIDGRLIRTLELGHQPKGIYHSRSRAAHWDGKNELGEPVASGIYFYTLTTDGFNATRKMLIRK